MSDEDKTKEAQKIYDAVLTAFPGLRDFMLSSQTNCSKLGYTETILGRRRHIPDMMLPEFEFKAMPGYVNPDIDPLDITTLSNNNDIPERVVKELKKEFSKYRYYGQIVKRTKELYEQKIKVINNRQKITEATRKVVNSIVQGSAAELTKIAILNLESNERWQQIGGKFIIPIHDELLVEVPLHHKDEGEALLKNAMESAGNFFPFTISCDVTTTTRWYGLECLFDGCHKKPDSIDTTDPDEIMWIQSHLFDQEYLLPVYKEEDGSKPRGDKAMGINGVVSEEYLLAIDDYIRKNEISEDAFIDHIERRVIYGDI